MKVCIALFVVMLVGCATPEERAAKDIARYSPYCDALGYKRDTDAWRDCIRQRSDAEDASMAAAKQRRQTILSAPKPQ